MGREAQRWRVDHVAERQGSYESLALEAAGMPPSGFVDGVKAKTAVEAGDKKVFERLPLSVKRVGKYSFTAVKHFTGRGDEIDKRVV